MTAIRSLPEDQGRGRLTAQAADRLRDAIVLGELPPGARVPERAVCERFGLSRTPLREALKILEAEGLVVLEPHRGAVVARLGLADVGAVMDVLIGLEGMAAGPACSRITDQELDTIARLHGRLVACRRDGALLDYFHVNQAVHQAIVDAAGNPVLSRIYRGESGRIWRYRYAGNREADRWDRAVREHEAILDALASRDGPLLREVMRAHLSGGWAVVKRTLSDELSPPLPSIGAAGGVRALKAVPENGGRRDP